MRIGSLTSAAHTAASGLNRVSQRLDAIAHEVASGGAVADGQPARDTSAAIVDLSLLENEARANAAVFRTSVRLLDELYSRPRL